MTAQEFNVAVVGATGLVGGKVLEVLEERSFPVARLLPLASAKSAGKKIKFQGKEHAVAVLTAESFRDIDVALFSAGATVSRDFAPVAARAGAIVIDNSSAFRLDPGVPLVVPEVNPHDIKKNSGIIANPNCSTIQMVVTLKPLHEKWKIRRVVVSTYQSVTGAGKRGVNQLEAEVTGKTAGEKKFPHPIAYNVLPQVDVFFEGGYSREELKMVNETRKIMGDDSLRVTATCVRVPVYGGHSESVNIEFEREFRLEDVVETLRAAPGVCIQDDILQDIYPMPIWSKDRDEVFVGRIRRDETVPNGLNLWIVSDNLRKGAATNAVQIAETWAKTCARTKSSIT